MFGGFVQSANPPNIFHGYALVPPGDREGRPYTLGGTSARSFLFCSRPFLFRIFDGEPLFPPALRAYPSFSASARKSLSACFPPATMEDFSAVSGRASPVTVRQMPPASSTISMPAA